MCKIYHIIYIKQKWQNGETYDTYDINSHINSDVTNHIIFFSIRHRRKCPKINLSDKEDLKILKKEEKIINYESKRIDKRCIERENVFLEDIEFIFYGYYKNKKLKKFALIPIYKQKKKHMKKILNKFVSKNPEFIYKIGNVSSTQFVEVKMLKKKGN